MIDQNRLALLLEKADLLGLNPELITESGLVSIDVAGTERYIFHKVSNPNNQMASQGNRIK